MRFDGYIRVSDTKGRSGESFLSPTIQRETIERLTKGKGVELAEPIIEELDVSGGKKIEDRELGRLIERVERGESAGVIVWKLSRFSRSLLDAVEATTRITAAGGRLIAEDFDSAAPMGKAMLGLLAGLAEEELDARREGWRQARARAVERGVPNGRAPFGYRKRRDGRLEVVEREAKIVRKVFKKRAEGVSFSQIAPRTGLVAFDRATDHHQRRLSRRCPLWGVRQRERPPRDRRPRSLGCSAGGPKAPGSADRRDDA